MERKDFKITRKDYELIEKLGKKDVGTIVKLLCKYVFEDVTVQVKDKYIQIYYNILKERIDQREFQREIGRKGGMKCAQLKKEEESNIEKDKEKGLIDSLPIDGIIEIMLGKEPKKADEK